MILTGETGAGLPVTSQDRQPARLKPRLEVLDGYRAIAILFVLAYHYTVRWAPPQDPSSHFPPGAVFDGIAPFEYGWLGVEFFFMISGFVILMTLERCRNVTDFAIRRFARLWPALLVAACLTSITIFRLGPADWQVAPFDYLASILLLDPKVASRVLYHAGIKWVDGAYWSLWTELRFYVWAAALYLLVRKKFVLVWLILFSSLPLGLLLSRLAIPAWLDSLHLAYPIRLLSAYVNVLPPHLMYSYTPYFTLGICAYEIWSKGSLRKLAIAGAAVAAGYVLYVAATQQNIFAGADVLIAIVANLLMFALFLLFVAGHPFSSIFANRPLVIMGQASYSLYLLHQNMGIAIMRQGIALGVPYWLVLPLVTGLMIAASLILFQFVELPAKAWILRHAQKIVAATDRHLPGLSYKALP